MVVVAMVVRIKVFNFMVITGFPVSGIEPKAGEVEGFSSGRGSRPFASEGYAGPTDAACRETQQARELARALGRKGGESYGEDYSTANSAQRLSATLSIRPRGRVQIIDM